MIDPASITAIASLIASIAATATSVGNTAKTVVETLEKKQGKGWKPNAESKKVLADISSIIGRSFPVFDGRNYKIWSMKMKHLLISYGIWDLVEEGYEEKGHNDKASKKDREKDSLIFLIILLAVDESVSRCVVNAKNSKEAWEAIKMQYEGYPWWSQGICGGPGGGTFFSTGEGPTSFRFNHRSADDIFAEFFGSSRPFGGMGGGDPGCGTFFSTVERLTSFRFNSRSADDIFAELFGSSKPFGGMGGGGPGMIDGRFGSMFGDHMFSSFGKGDGGSMHQSAHRKAPPIEHTLPCSLEDLYKGTTKKMKISREIIGGSGKTMTVEEILIINIKPGWKKGTKITFPEKGDEHPGVIPADIVFIIDEKPHKLFTRDGNDLVATQKIEAFTGYKVHLTTLDGRNFTIPINSMIHPNYEEVVPREGMPISKDPSKKGNLRIKFST